MDELSIRREHESLAEDPSEDGTSHNYHRGKQFSNRALVVPSSPTPSRGVYGRFCSLYSNLEDATVFKLEEAILLGLVQAFNPSLDIFESFPLSLKHNAVIAIEHCLVLWNDMRYLEAAEILRDAISFAERNGQDVRAHRIYTVMSLLLANAEILTEGDLTSAREILIETRSWLQDVAIEEIDDVQVGD